jgi:hypothetical protein
MFLPALRARQKAEGRRQKERKVLRYAFLLKSKMFV